MSTTSLERDTGEIRRRRDSAEEPTRNLAPYAVLAPPLRRAVALPPAAPERVIYIPAEAAEHCDDTPVAVPHGRRRARRDLRYAGRHRRDTPGLLRRAIAQLGQLLSRGGAR